MALLRIGVGSETGAALLGRTARSFVLGLVGEVLAPDDRELRAALVGAQIQGLLLDRYVLGHPDLVEASAERLVASVGPVIQRYLTGPLDGPVTWPVPGDRSRSRLRTPRQTLDPDLLANRRAGGVSGRVASGRMRTWVGSWSPASWPAWSIATLTTPVGVSGAVFLLPVQAQRPRVPSPAVSATNLLYNVISVPGALLRYGSAGRSWVPLAVGCWPGQSPAWSSGQPCAFSCCRAGRCSACWSPRCCWHSEAGC